MFNVSSVGRGISDLEPRICFELLPKAWEHLKLPLLAVVRREVDLREYLFSFCYNSGLTSVILAHSSLYLEVRQCKARLGPMAAAFSAIDPEITATPDRILEVIPWVLSPQEWLTMKNIILLGIIADISDSKSRSLVAGSLGVLILRMTSSPIVPCDIIEDVITGMTAAARIIQEKADSPEWMAVVSIHTGSIDGDTQGDLVRFHTKSTYSRILMRRISLTNCENA